MELTFFQKVKEFFKRYERHVSSGALIVGFVIDSFALQRIDLPQTSILLFTYLFISGFGITLLNLFESKRVIWPRLYNLHPWILSAVQFAFGGLFSSFVLFYFRSASLGVSFLFVALLASLLIGNELFKKRYARVGFQMSIYFFVLFSFCILYVPVLVKRMGDLVFIGSGVVSLILMTLFVLFVRRVAPIQIKKGGYSVWLSVFAIYLIIHVFYFLNILPPIPLSLKAMGVYHYIERVQNVYIVQSEKETLKNFFTLYDPIHIAKGDPLYVYSSVFAPTDLQTKIIYHWQYYDEKDKAWITTGTLAFPIVGGRDGGYRGYSVKDNFFPGKWRISLETERGQTIGRVRFTIVETTDSILLETGVRS